MHICRRSPTGNSCHRGRRREVLSPMNERTEAIVLHALRHTDTSTIVHAYTRKRGHLTFAVKGGSTSGKGSRGASGRRLLTRKLSLVEVDYGYIPGREVLRPTEVRSLHTFTAHDASPERGAMALFLSELLYRTLRFPTGDERLFDFLRETVLALDDPATPMGNFHLVFLRGYAEMLGLSPHEGTYVAGSLFDPEEGMYVPSVRSTASSFPADESSALHALHGITYSESSSLRIDQGLKRRLLQSMIEYLRVHLGHFAPLRSLDVIYTLFA